MIRLTCNVDNAHSDSTSVELFGMRFRSHPGTSIDADLDVRVIGMSKRGGRIFVKQGDVVEGWSRAALHKRG